MRYLIAAAMLLGQVCAYAQTAPRLNEAALREAMEENLKDSDSAKFKNIKHKPSGAAGMWDLCGEVNAKNSFGAYSGYSPFYGVAMKNKGQPVHYIVLSIGEVAGQMCQEKGM